MNDYEMDFAYFCRRVCAQCHGEIRGYLPTCPFIMFDAWRYLKTNHENGINGHPAKDDNLKSEIAMTVTDELVKAIGNHARKTNRS